jgi:hypothetical protein
MGKRLASWTAVALRRFSTVTRTHSHLTLFAGEFIFDDVKPALHNTKRRSISKYVGVLKARGSCPDDFMDTLRGIQRGLDEMKAGTGKPFRVALDEIRAKHKIPFPKS